MTEDEAREKWCPMGLVPWQIATSELGDPIYVVHNRDSDGYIPANKAYRCIASDCMMWKGNEIYRGTADEIYRGTADGKLETVIDGDCGLKR